MCVDYTDLDNVLPKDAYPLSNIDRLVDGASNQCILNLLDVYLEYNQILIYPSNSEKTAFIIDPANYFYQVMPFELKNVGTTYHRLINIIF